MKSKLMTFEIADKQPTSMLAKVMTMRASQFFQKHQEGDKHKATDKIVAHIPHSHPH